MRRRSYESDADVALLQAFNAASIAATGGCGYVHPGEIPHRLFNGNKYFEPAEVMTVWEDRSGVAAWVLVKPRHRSYDAQVRSDLRGGKLEREVLEYGDARTAELMRLHGIESDQMLGDALRCDLVRVELLAEMGWEPDGKPPLRDQPNTDRQHSRAGDPRRLFPPPRGRSGGGRRAGRTARGRLPASRLND